MLEKCFGAEVLAYEILAQGIKILALTVYADNKMSSQF